MGQFIVTAVGVDRPGIVAAVTSPLAELGCNLEDSSSTILRGHFAMMVVTSAPAGLDAAALEAAIRPHAVPLGLLVTVGAVEAAGKAPIATHLLSVYGADRPGIVREVAAFLADRGIDITDLQTRLLGRNQSVYVALLEVALPPELPDLTPAVVQLSQTLGVDVSLRPIESDSL